MAKRSGLGRGLESLFSEATAEAGSGGSSTLVALSSIQANPNQPRKRFDETELAELADSIRQNGVLQPILLRPIEDKYEIVAGERRYQAASLAGLEEIPALIREVSDDEMFKLALIENLQRSDLDPIEEARGLRKLLEDNDLTQSQLAYALSKSRSAIANALRLLDLPEEVQAYLEDGRLSAGHARAILSVSDDEGRKKLADKVVAEHLSVRQTENLASLFSVNATERPKAEPTPSSFRRAARQLRVLLNTNVKVRRVRNKNKVEIEFADEDDLKRIVEMLSKGYEPEATDDQDNA